MKEESRNTSGPRPEYMPMDEEDYIFDKASDSFDTYMECMQELKNSGNLIITSDSQSDQVVWIPLQSPYCDNEPDSPLSEYLYPNRTEYIAHLLLAVLKKPLHGNLRLDGLMCKSEKDGVCFCIYGRMSSDSLQIQNGQIPQV